MSTLVYGSVRGATVYAALSERSSLIKIGVTQVRLETRLYQVNKGDGAGPLALLAKEEFTRAIEGHRREKQLHKLFAQFRVYGEWFAITPWQLRNHFPRKEIL